MDDADPVVRSRDSDRRNTFGNDQRIRAVEKDSQSIYASWMRGDVSVSEVEPEQVGVCILGGSRGWETPAMTHEAGAASPPRSSPWGAAGAPAPDGAPGDARPTRDLAVVQASRSEGED